MGAFEIQGGCPLKGEIIPQGAKNEALQILCAVLLTSEPVHVQNIPKIQDIKHLMCILKNLGVTIRENAHGNYTFQANNLELEYLSTEKFQKEASRIRGSVMIVGPLLARFGKVFLQQPGGDKIGRRRLDTHFQGFTALGARFDYSQEKRIYKVHAERLTGAYVLLEEASITGTANVLMAAVLARGKTTIYNAACEPYIQQLCKMLISMGARIEGTGSNLLIIQGVETLGGCSHEILPDMIEIGSWIALAALSRSEITIKNVSWQNIGVIPASFRKLGIELERREDDIYVPSQAHYRIQKFIDGSILTLADAPWPGLSPDLLSVLLVTATQAKGSVLIHQKMFESRLFFVDKLIEMGAQIILCDPHRATVIGMNHDSPLRGSSLNSPDIRAGIALLIAALSAEGKSIIHNIEQIDRGYERIDERLQALGAKIKRL